MRYSMLILAAGLWFLPSPVEARGLGAWLGRLVHRRPATKPEPGRDARGVVQRLDSRLRQNRRRRPLSQKPVDRFFHHLQRQQHGSAPLLFNDADGNFQQVHQTAVILGQGVTRDREPWRVIVAPKGVMGVKPRVLVQRKVRVAASSYYEPNLPNILTDPLGTALGLHSAGERHRVPAHSRWVDMPRSSAFVDRIPVKDLQRGLDQVVREATSKSPPQIEARWINP